MGLGYIVVAVVAVAVTVFTLQNTDPATVRFLAWRLELPLAGVMLIALGAGLLAIGLPLAIRLSVWRRRARSHETRVAMLEAAVEERDRQLLRLQPPKAR
ncbi:MAG TPA: LapA family protein [Methylomirabilota bacterium]|nr:LapA family protein [Methylomirabilota bacterium]